MRKINGRLNEIINEYYDLLIKWHKIQLHVHMYKLEYNNNYIPLFLSVAFVFFSHSYISPTSDPIL